MKRDEEYRKYHNTPNCICVVCGKSIYIKPSRIKKVKNGVTCSLECDRKRRCNGMFKGENNSQYGLRGKLNASFKSEKRINNAGYVTVSVPDHPFCNSDFRVLEHRLVVEKNAELFDSKYFVSIEGKKYLKPEVEVHHKNEIRNDNRIENLMPLSKSEHTKLHNSMKEIMRDKKTGRILTFVSKQKKVVNN